MPVEGEGEVSPGWGVGDDDDVVTTGVAEEKEAARQGVAKAEVGGDEGTAGVVMTGGCG